LDPNGTAVHADGTSAAGTGISTVSSAPTVNLAISSGPGVWNVEDTAISILAATADVARVQEEINTVQHSTFAAHIAVERWQRKVSYTPTIFSFTVEKKKSALTVPPPTNPPPPCPLS
jgi:hypothetical protein